VNRSRSAAGGPLHKGPPRLGRKDQSRPVRIFSVPDRDTLGRVRNFHAVAAVTSRALPPFMTHSACHHRTALPGTHTTIRTEPTRQEAIMDRWHTLISAHAYRLPARDYTNGHADISASMPIRFGSYPFRSSSPLRPAIKSLHAPLEKWSAGPQGSWESRNATPSAVRANSTQALASQ
jgi:hypothetical protein